MDALVGALGALAYESLKLFTLWEEKGGAAFKARVRDKTYAVAVVVLVVASGFIAWAITPRMSGGGDTRYWACIIGAGARPIMAALIQSAVALVSLVKPKDKSNRELSLSGPSVKRSLMHL